MNTHPERTQATTPHTRRRNGPGELDWWARKQHGRCYDDLDPILQQQIRDERSEYFAEFARRGRAGKRRLRAARLRERAAHLLAEADRLDAEDWP
ncbi:hypothetical protein [Mycobacterium kubicae]|uniref:hypothetical protein n=1 Tax=Mycobacterium kubicae TaxID=120959 RepID=UPI0007FF08BD|nr:hypothetical protein [Mycobacterium kubicae]OBK53144.1 hypothetical protein A5657_15565 [Mycobacterium kubicae]